LPAQANDANKNTLVDNRRLITASPGGFTSAVWATPQWDNAQLIVFILQSSACCKVSLRRIRRKVKAMKSMLVTLAALPSATAWAGDGVKLTNYFPPPESNRRWPGVSTLPASSVARAVSWPFAGATTSDSQSSMTSNPRQTPQFRRGHLRRFYRLFVSNRAKSKSPDHREALLRLRAALDVWITETGDRLRFLEPREVVAPFEREMHEWFGTPVLEIGIGSGNYAADLNVWWAWVVFT
jgi:hypothetical protein